MKSFRLIFVTLLFASCNHSQGDIEFTGNAPGINYGHVSINDLANNVLYRATIEAGKFNLGKQYLKASGYYKLLFSIGSKSSRKVDVYLEPGTYNINIDQKNINNYPVITSSSKIQAQLSAYYMVADSINTEIHKKVVALNTQIKGLKDQLLKPGQYTSMVDSLQGAELNANQVDELKIFTVFMQKYPENDVAAHILLKMDYQDEPAIYYKMFRKFSETAKTSDEGKELESKLKPLAKMTAGEPAPAIAGTTPDGRTITIKSLNKKIILVDFWRSSNGSSRDNHQQMQKDLLKKFEKKGLGILSVSFDTDKNKWLAAIDLDKLQWPQLSDLKGDDSPNVENWGIKNIPSYYLLDSEGRIIEHVAAYADVDMAIDNYLKKH